MTGSVLIHVQYLLGIGHLQRTRRIGEALARRGIAVTLVSGGPPVPALEEPRRLRLVQLPPIRALDSRFELVDNNGRPIDATIRAARLRMLLDAFTGSRPDVVVVEGFPFARRAFRFELDPLIVAARQAGARLVCSIRDIVNPRDDPVRDDEIVRRVRSDFDLVLVHGDPSLVPFDAGFPAATEISDRLRYTGYVTERAAVEHGETSGGEILVSAGGGPAGRVLLQTALAARKLGCLAERPWRLLAGGGLPDADFAALTDDAPPGLVVERFRADFPALLRRCHISVSQAGYNTALDILTMQKRAVLVPFAAGREREQLIRAGRIAALGAAEMLRESELSAANLAAAIEAAAGRHPTAIDLDIDGAETSATLIAELVATGAPGGSAAVRGSGIIPR
ncbi:MAG TPA: glycosyltransferase [Stellaceae bacterium]|jgi:predicted glycosyltransferase|nr:glycosyltransferase [Stellaceae bacterium]